MLLQRLVNHTNSNQLHEIWRNYKTVRIGANFVAFKNQRLFLAGCFWRMSNEFPILPLDRRPTLCVTEWVILWFLSPCTRGLGEVGSSGPVQPGQLLQSLPSTSQITKAWEVHYSFCWKMLSPLGNLLPFFISFQHVQWSWFFIFLRPAYFRCFPNLH